MADPHFCLRANGLVNATFLQSAMEFSQLCSES